MSHDRWGEHDSITRLLGYRSPEERFRPFSWVQVAITWMLAAGLICAAALWLVGCASPGDFPGDHGCETDPQSCK